MDKKKIDKSTQTENFLIYDVKRESEDIFENDFLHDKYFITKFENVILQTIGNRGLIYENGNLDNLVIRCSLFDDSNLEIIEGKMKLKFFSFSEKISKKLNNCKSYNELLKSFEIILKNKDK